MSFSLSGAITGGAQTGFTSPTYTVTADNAPDNRSKQYAITALGGTQTGVVAHSVNAPFTQTVRRPSVLKTLVMAVLNGVTGQYSRIPFNDYVIITRKAAQVAAGQWVTNEYRTTLHVAAGTETYDASNVRAGVSMHIGGTSANSAGLGDLVTTGILG